MPIRIVNQIVNTLKEAGILSEVVTRRGEAAYQPAIDINQLTLRLLETKVDEHGAELFLEAKSHEMDTFRRKMLAIREQTDTALNNILIKNL